MTTPPPSPRQDRRLDTAVLALSVAMVLAIIGCFALVLVNGDVPQALAILTASLVGAVAATLGVKIRNGHKETTREEDK